MADNEEEANRSGNKNKDDSSPSSPSASSEKPERAPEEGRRGVTRLRDIMRRQRRDSDVKIILLYTIAR